MYFRMFLGLHYRKQSVVVLYRYHRFHECGCAVIGVYFVVVLFMFVFYEDVVGINRQQNNEESVHII